MTCPHCQNVTELAPVDTGNDDSDDDIESSRGRHRSDSGQIPQIVIIQAPAAQPTPRVVAGPTIVVRRSSSFSLVGSIVFFVLVSVAISTYMHIRAAHLGAAIPAAEKEAERAATKAEKGAEKAAEKPPEHRKR